MKKVFKFLGFFAVFAAVFASFSCESAANRLDAPKETKQEQAGEVKLDELGETPKEIALAGGGKAKVSREGGQIVIEIEAESGFEPKEDGVTVKVDGEKVAATQGGDGKWTVPADKIPADAQKIEVAVEFVEESEGGQEEQGEGEGQGESQGEGEGQGQGETEQGNTFNKSVEIKRNGATIIEDGVENTPTDKTKALNDLQKKFEDIYNGVSDPSKDKVSISFKTNSDTDISSYFLDGLVEKFKDHPSNLSITCDFTNGALITIDRLNHTNKVVSKEVISKFNPDFIKNATIGKSGDSIDTITAQLVNATVNTDVNTISGGGKGLVVLNGKVKNITGSIDGKLKLNAVADDKTKIEVNLDECNLDTTAVDNSKVVNVDGTTLPYAKVIETSSDIIKTTDSPDYGVGAIIKDGKRVLFNSDATIRTSSRTDGVEYNYGTDDQWRQYGNGASAEEAGLKRFINGEGDIEQWTWSGNNLVASDPKFSNGATLAKAKTADKFQQIGNIIYRWKEKENA